MDGVRHPLPAVAACAAAVVLGVCSLGGPVAVAVGVTAMLIVVALGWPQLLGAPARTSLTTVLGLTGIAATWAVTLWPLRDDGRPVLLEPIAVCIALGAMAAFMVQLVRGHGRPYRLESTAGTVTGVTVVACGAGWPAVTRSQELTDGSAGALLLSVAASLVVAAVSGVVPGPRWLGPVLGVVAGAVVPLAVHWTPAALPALPLASAVVGGALAALILTLMGELAPRQSGRPAGFRATLAHGVAPVVSAGLLTYVVLKLLPL